METLQESVVPDPVDFFVSYTGVDEEIAEWVAWCLEDEGFSVRFQKWDFRPGTNFILAMQEAVTRARRIVIILSKEYEQAEFTRPEWAAYLVEDPTGAHGRLLPVRVEDFKPTGLLAPIVYIDLVPCLRNNDKEQGREEARKTLRGGLLESRPKPICEPNFPTPRN